MADTITALIDTEARTLNTLYTWARATGMRCERLVDAADVRHLTLVALEEKNLITGWSSGGQYQVEIFAAPWDVLLKCRIKLTDAGKRWVETRPNMLLRKIDAAGRAGLDLQQAQGIASDSRIIRWALDEGYATLHHLDNDEEMAMPRRWPGGNLRIYILRPTRKIRKRLGS